MIQFIPRPKPNKVARRMIAKRPSICHIVVWFRSRVKIESIIISSLYKFADTAEISKLKASVVKQCGNKHFVVTDPAFFLHTVNMLKRSPRNAVYRVI